VTDQDRQSDPAADTTAPYRLCVTGSFARSRKDFIYTSCARLEAFGIAAIIGFRGVCSAQTREPTAGRNSHRLLSIDQVGAYPVFMMIFASRHQQGRNRSICAVLVISSTAPTA